MFILGQRSLFFCWVISLTTVENCLLLTMVLCTHTHTGAQSTGTKHFNFDTIRDELQAAGACEGETLFPPTFSV